MNKIRKSLEAQLTAMARGRYIVCCSQAAQRRLDRGESLEAPFTLGELIDTPAGQKLVAAAEAIGDQLGRRLAAQ